MLRGSITRQNILPYPLAFLLSLTSAMKKHFCFVSILGICLTMTCAGQNVASTSAIKDPVPLFEQLPKELTKELREGSKTIEEALVKANQMLMPKVKELPCELEGSVTVVEKRFERGTINLNGYIVNTHSENARVNGTVFYYYYYLVFDKSQEAKISKLKRGDRIKVSGTAAGGMFMSSNKRPVFMLSVKDAKLK